MYLKYGTVEFQSRKTWLDWNYTPVMSDRGFLMSYRVQARFGGTASITGAETITDLETKMSTIQAGMLIPNQDFGLYHEDDSPSVHVIEAADTMDGTRMHFSWMKGSARAARGNSNEYVNLRSFQGMCSFELDYCEEAVPIWRETVRQIGTGGTQNVVMESLTGTPIVQPVQASTQVVLVQEGYAAGWSGYPSFPPLAYPALISSKNAIYERGSPIYGRNSTRLFPIRWLYLMEMDIAPLSPVYPTDPPALAAP